jgi:hypothetical protein
MWLWNSAIEECDSFTATDRIWRDFIHLFRDLRNLRPHIGFLNECIFSSRCVNMARSREESLGRAESGIGAR